MCPQTTSFMLENVMKIIYLPVITLVQFQEITPWPLTLTLVFGCQLKCMRVWGCERVCSQHSIPVSNTKHSSALCSPSPKQTAPSGSQNENQIKHRGRRPEKAAADVVRPYQWPRQPDDTVHTQLQVPDTKHTHIHHWVFLSVVTLSGAEVKLSTVLLYYQ